MNRIITHIISALVLMASSGAYAENGDTYNASNNTLTIPSITVGNTVYTNVVIGNVAKNIISIGGSATALPVSFTTIGSEWSSNSGVYIQNVVIRDQAAWADLWIKYTSRFGPQPPLPSVDFNTNMVLGVSANGGGCASMSITSVTQLNSNITVEYQIPPIPAGVTCTANVATITRLILVPKFSGYVIFVQK